MPQRSPLGWRLVWTELLAAGDFFHPVASATVRSSGRQGSDIHVTEVEPWPGSSRLVSHLATYSADGDGAEQTAALMIAAPEVIVTRALRATAAAESARTDGGTGDLLLLAVAYNSPRSSTAGSVMTPTAPNTPSSRPPFDIEALSALVCGPRIGPGA